MIVADIATLNLGIEALAARVAEAQSKAAGAMDKVMKAVTGSDVAKKDIQTQYFSIQQVTKWGQNREEQVVVGYLGNEQVHYRDKRYS